MENDSTDNKILRRFAIDCAERALRRESDAGRNPPEDLWSALYTAREGRLEYAETLADIVAFHCLLDKDAMLRYAACSVRSAAAKNAVLAAEDAAAYDATHAAMSESETDCYRQLMATNAERKWQMEHLCALIATNGGRA